MSEKELMPTSPHATGLPPGVDPQQMAAEEDSETPTPEEQKMYDKFVTRAVAFIHGDQTQAAVLEMLNDKSQPAHVSVGRAASKIVQLVQQSAKSAGEEVPESVLYGAGQEIVADLLETGAEAKIFPLKPDSKEYDEALELSFLEAVKSYGEGLLQGPEGAQISQRAQDEYAGEVAKEADQNALDPQFLQMMQEQEAQFGRVNPVSDGVSKAVNSDV